MLRLGSQRIPVRQLIHGPDAEQQLARIADSLLPAFFPEQFLVLHGFSAEQVTAIRRKLRRTGFRFTVGTLPEYLRWLKSRLGPLAAMPLDSPVRSLVEPLLCFIRRSEPTALAPVHGDYSDSAISDSFTLGQLGVQAVETILTHMVGQHRFRNVEGELEWQRKDVDLLVQLERLIRLEIKTENYVSGFLSLEDVGNLTKKSPGWLHLSDCQVLGSITWPSGEIWFQDFARVKEWALSGKHGMSKATGSARGQSYKSLFYLAPIDTLFDTFDDTLVLRIQDFLPSLYRGKFDQPSQVKKRYASRVLQPQRPD